MREVNVIGIGQTKVGEHWERSLRDLALESMRAALKDAGVEVVEALYVGNMLSGELARQEHLATLLADFAGLRGLEAIRVEAADASGAAAVRMGYLAVASGVYDLVMVTGVEKTSDADNGLVAEALALASDGEYEAIHGLSSAATSALLMRRYIYQYGVKQEDFAGFAINAHQNATHNPYAMLQRPISLEAFKEARMIADPVNLLDCAPLGDGAATIILSSEGNMSPRPVKIVASALSTDSLALHDREEPLFLKAAHDSSQKAYAQAGVGPEDIGLFELHDSFTILAALSLEACGFATRGQGAELAKNGEITIGGRIPISTMGGLKGRGNPLGATGVYQIVEVVQQLRGQAGPNQVECSLGMAQSLGGNGATAITHILAK